MFKLASYKNNILTDVDIIVSTAIEVVENHVPKSNFTDCKPMWVGSILWH